MMEGDLIWGAEYTVQHTDDILQNCIPENYIILLTNVIPINSIKNKPLKTIKKVFPVIHQNNKLCTQNPRIIKQEMGQKQGYCEDRGTFSH